MDIAGHVSKQMLKQYSHIRMEAKRTALESIVQKQAAKPAEPEQDDSPVPAVKRQIEGQYPQKSPQSEDSSRDCRGKKGRKPLKRLAPQVGLEPTTLRLTAETEVICRVLPPLAISC